MPLTYTTSDACLSKDGVYRYHLIRRWRPGGLLLFVLLNPSTADGEQDDPTVRRCVEFADKLGFGGMVIVNLYAFRASHPSELLKVADPVGPLNDVSITYWALQCEQIVCGWGVNGHETPRAEKVKKMLEAWHEKVHALKLTNDGAPSHPLARGKHRISSEAQPFPF